MSFHDNVYLNLVEDVLTNGRRKTNRTGIDTLSVFSRQMRFDLRDGTIPLLTTKKMFTRGVIREILWYLQAGSNIKYLNDHDVHIWDEWTDQDGNLGPVYGVAWRQWLACSIVGEEPGGLKHCIVDQVDQIANLVANLKNNPNDRRLLVTAWNPALVPDPLLSFSENVANGKQALPPCHYTFQCYVNQLDNGTNELSMMLNQRSCDIGLGVPFNIVQYSILLRMLAHVTNMVPGEFIWNGGDVHIYENHIDQLKVQLDRQPYRSPTFKFARTVSDIDDFQFEDFVIEDYQSHSTLKMDVAT